MELWLAKDIECCEDTINEKEEDKYYHVGCYTSEPTLYDDDRWGGSTSNIYDIAFDELFGKEIWALDIKRGECKHIKITIEEIK